MRWMEKINISYCPFAYLIWQVNSLDMTEWRGLKWRSSERVRKLKILCGISIQKIFTHTKTAFEKRFHSSFFTPLTITQNTYCVQLCKQSNMSEMMRGSNYIHGNLCIKMWKRLDVKWVKLNPKTGNIWPSFLLTLKISMQFLKLLLMLAFLEVCNKIFISWM